MGLPKENLDSKNFEDLVNEALALIPIYASNWTDHNVHDLGITLIDLFAYLTEAQFYKLNRINYKNYFKYLKILGVSSLTQAVPAQTQLVFSSKDSSDQYISKSTKVSNDSDDSVVFETQNNLMISTSNIQYLLSLDTEGNFLNCNELNNSEILTYQPFGEEASNISTFYVGFDTALTISNNYALGVILSDVLFAPDNLDTNFLYNPISFKWQYLTGDDWEDAESWSDLTIENDSTLEFSYSGTIAFGIEKDMSLGTINNNQAYWFRCVAEKKNDQSLLNISPIFNEIALNAVKAIQTETYSKKTFTSDSLPNMRLDLSAQGIVTDSLQVSAYENGELVEWECVQNFDCSDEDSKHFLVDAQNGKIYFGNGVKGKIPEKGQSMININFSTTQGSGGNLGKGEITILSSSYENLLSVTNNIKSFWGTDSENLLEAILRTKKSIKELKRAVTSDDYEEILLESPELKIERVKVLPNYNPFFPTKSLPKALTIVTVPLSDQGLISSDPLFLENIYNYLDSYRLLTTDLYIMYPEYSKISVDANVNIKKSYITSSVISEIEDALNAFLNPNTGGFDSLGWAFGRSIYESEIYQLISNIEGVNYVEDITLYKDDEQFSTEVALSQNALCTPGEMQISSVSE